jgi:hypothetical protein
MTHAIQTLKAAFRNDPVEFTKAVVFLVTVSIFTYLSFTLASI